ncbi:MAG: hypothetical protein Q3M24_20370 [Candidatus Electrothrix aestuarii]|uniref:Uncharacterized protein n=1 Tax=Candidatus Electrothrix aestuarii TaxID=3062594 RepID=A0AAU8LSX8_9BACT|nr:hypothetical protein [Candidatus Electrothrix aestuarii]
MAEKSFLPPLLLITMFNILLLHASLITFCSVFLAYSAYNQHGISFLPTFFEILSGPIALGWGMAPAAASFGGFLATIVFAFFVAGMLVLGALFEKKCLHWSASIAWMFFGFMGTFFYAT